MQEMYEMWVPSLGWEEPLGEDTATHSPTPVFFPRTPWREDTGGHGPQGRKESCPTEDT